MSRLTISILIVVLLIAGGIFAYLNFSNPKPSSTPEQTAPAQNPETSDQPVIEGSTNSEDALETQMAYDLDTPWAIAFLPNGDMLVTERPGRVRLISDGQLQKEPAAILKQAKEIGEGGLLGIALHPDFATNNYVYLYYTYTNTGDNTLNRVVRMTYQNNQLTNETSIVNDIPGASNHNGGRIKFGPDKFLYITTGDAQEPSLAQERGSLAGKILRVTDEGRRVEDNPFQTLVYSYGHRNPQGIAWDSNGRLWETEHGPSGGSLGTGNDEINQIIAGENYGWPTIQGDQTQNNMVTPLKNSTPSTSWAPGGAAFIGNSLFFGGLRGQALYEAIIENGKVVDFKEHFKSKYGRIREVIAGPDGMLYITTSNMDGRGVPEQIDDRIIKINPEKL